MEHDILTPKMNTPEELEFMKESIDFLNKQLEFTKDYFYKYTAMKIRQKQAYKKYRHSDKGKEAVRKAKANYYQKVKAKREEIKKITTKEEDKETIKTNEAVELNDDFYNHFYGS